MSSHGYSATAAFTVDRDAGNDDIAEARFAITCVVDDDDDVTSLVL